MRPRSCDAVRESSAEPLDEFRGKQPSEPQKQGPVQHSGREHFGQGVPLGFTGAEQQGSSLIGHPIDLAIGRAPETNSLGWLKHQ